MLRRRWSRRQKRRNEHSGRQEHAGHDARHHRQDRPVPHAGGARLRQWQELLCRRRQSQEGGRGFRWHSGLRFGERCEEGHWRGSVRDLRSTAVRRRGDRRGSGRGPGPGDLHHRRHPGARQDPHQVPHAGQADAARGAELPRRDHARRDQDRHHAGPHPQEGSGGGRVALRDADLRSGRAADGGRPRPVELRRHRRRSCQRTEARRRSAHVQRRPADRGGDHGGRDRRLGRGNGGALGEGPHEKTDRRLHRRHHRAARKAHGPRRRHHLRRQGHRAGKARRHGGVRHQGDAQPRGDGEDPKIHTQVIRFPLLASLPYAATIFLSSFLLFLVQPIIAMQILPWFGGSAAVWTTCLVSFQSVLLAGYAYAGLCALTGRLSMNGFGTDEVPAAARAAPLSMATQLQWLALAAMGSVMLLAVTNHITQNVASVPFLWVLPLALYLGSFILAFDHPRWYVRPLFIVVLVGLLPAMAFYVPSLKLHVAVPLYLIGLFVSCIFCHGELARLKPDPLHLTRYYLMISLGGAFGAVLVAILAPLTLPGYFELGIALVLLALLLVLRLRRIFMWGGVAVSVVTALLVVRGVHDYSAGVRVMERDFYGVVRTADHDSPIPYRSMYHGPIMHGGQLLGGSFRNTPPESFGPPVRD